MAVQQESSLSDTTTIYLFCIIESIFILIFCPLSLYFTLKIWHLSKREELFVMKRRPLLVVVDVIIFNFTPLVFALSLLPTHIDALNVFPPDIQTVVHEEMANFFDLCVYLTLARVWLLFYDYKHSAQTLKYQWEKHIHCGPEKKPWALRFKPLGNSKMIHLVVIFCWISVDVVVAVGTLTNRINAHIFHLAITLPAQIAIVILSWAVRRHNDIFFLKQELMLIAFFSIITMASLATSFVMFPDEEDHLSNAYLLLSNGILCGWCYAVALISTAWVFWKYTNRKEDERETNDKCISLEQVLSSRKGFKAFANYLVTEYATESLFFLFEVMQFKNELIESKIIKRANAGVMMNIGFMEEKTNHDTKHRPSDGTESIPKSPEKFREDLQAIINQYITSDSKRCINISSKVRKKILLSMPKAKSPRLSLNLSFEFKKNPKSLDLERIGSAEADKDGPGTPPDSDDEDIHRLGVRDGVSDEVIESKTCDLHSITPGTLTQEVSGSKSKQLQQPDHDVFETRMTSMSCAIHQIAAHHIEERTFFEQKLEKLDLAVEEVIKLLKRDSLFRFYSSPEYNRLMMRSLTEIESDTSSPRKSTLSGWRQCDIS